MRPFSPRARRALASAAVALGATVTFSACAAVRRPPATEASLRADAAVQRADQRALLDTVVARLARRAVARGDRTLDVLLLSGGGQHGAYGAGFLRGWQARSDAPMPRFDLVTGISTGALQSPFALLGTPASLDTLATLYRRAADRIAPTVDWWFWLRRTGGVVNTARYRATLERTLDDATRDALRARFAEDRQLLVATADFDLGVGRTWDLARELDTTAAGLARAHTILLGATAIPGVFPPVVLDGHVHADGGVIGNVLPVLDLDAYRALGTRLRAAGVTEPVTVRVWTIFNVWTHAEPQVTNPASRRGMTKRSNGLLFFAAQPQLLQQLAATARAASAEVPNVRVELRYTAIPDSLATAPAARKLFDAGWMRRLEQIGEARARSATPWDSLVSAYARP